MLEIAIIFLFSKNIHITLQNSSLTSNEELDARSKHILSYKYNIAEFLRLLYPDLKDYSLDYIVEECFEEKDKTFLTPLSENMNPPKTNKFIEDLVFKIRTIQDFLFKIPFSYFVFNFDTENRQESYELSVRALFYATELLQRENEFFNLPTTTQLYEESVPVVSVWINLKPRAKMRNTIEKSQLTRKIGRLTKNNEIKYETVEEVPLLTTFIINVGSDLDMNEKNIFTFARGLLSTNPDEVIKTMDLFGIPHRSSEEEEMVLPGIEQVAYDKGIQAGKEIGVETGKEIGIEKGRIEQREEDQKQYYQTFLQVLLEEGFSERKAKTLLEKCGFKGAD